MTHQTMLWQVVIHVTFVFSAVALAWIDRLTDRSSGSAKH
jgi:uncharacterized membrane protein YqhA